MKRKLPGENFVNLGKPHEVVLFLEILEYAVPFATGRCRKFKPDLLVEWKASHNAPCLPTKFLHNHRFPWVLVIPREIEDNTCSKIWGVNKVHYGLGENVN